MSLTNRDRKLIMILAPLALALAYWFMILSPKQAEVSKIDKDLTEAQTKRDAAEQQVNQLNAAKASFGSDYATVIRLGKAIPSSVDMPTLLVQLNHAAKGTGVHIQDFKPGAVGSGSGSSAGAAPSGSNGSANKGSSGQSGSTAPGGGSNPAAPGSAPAQSWPGKQAQKAGGAVTTANNASQGAANATANGPGATGSTPAPGTAGAVANGSNAPGLSQVPLTFTLKGSFFNLADFFHRMKRFVRVVNNQIEVRGRLLTIDSFNFQHSQTGPASQLSATVNATIYLSPADQGVSAGATPQGPGATPAGGSSPTPATGTPSTAPSTPTATATP